MRHSNQLAIVEPNKPDAEHLTFNWAVIRGLLRRQNGPITLFCESKHFRQLGLNNSDLFAHYEIPVVSIIDRAFTKKALVEFSTTIYCLFKIRTTEIRNVVFT